MAMPAWKQRQKEAEEQRKQEIEEERQRKAALAAGQQPVAAARDSVASVSTVETHKDFSSVLNQEAYVTIAQIIRQHGKPNNKYPKDKDLAYGQLLEICEQYGVGNVTAVLGTMKKQKRVDFVDPFISDTTMLTLIEDYNQDIKSELLSYEDLVHLAEKEKTSHQKAAGW